MGRNVWEVEQVDVQCNTFRKHLNMINLTIHILQTKYTIIDHLNTLQRNSILEIGNYPYAH